MKLREFSQEILQEWRSAGYQQVKITGSEHLSVNELPGGAFVLLEPVQDAHGLADGDMAEPIGSPVVTEIIRQKKGRYYQ